MSFDNEASNRDNDAVVEDRSNVILDVSGPSEHGYWNFEGDSAKLGSGVMGRRTQGFPYFAFEELWVEGCMEMQRIGFTATQIMEARTLA